jgi:thiol-disulfide isomerase/thioredoxin
MAVMGRHQVGIGKRAIFVLLSSLLLVSISIAERKHQEAVDFDLEVLQGEASGRLEDSAGKVVILEFWATYCGWCKATHPKLAEFASDHEGRVVVFGISAQKKSRLRRYLRSHDTGLTILHDRGGKVSRAYRADKTPTLVVIDASGKVRAWGQGANKLKQILAVAADLVENS